VNVCIREKTD